MINSCFSANSSSKSTISLICTRNQQSIFVRLKISSRMKPARRAWRCSAIDFTAVAHGDDEDLQFTVTDFVNHPVIAHANPASRRFNFFISAGREFASSCAKRDRMRFTTSSGRRSNSFWTERGRMTRYFI